MKERKEKKPKIDDLKKKKKKTNPERPHSPMKLDALFKGISHHQMLKETTTLYQNANEVDRATIIEEIIKYIIIIEVDMENINKKALDDVWNILMERRREAI